MMGDGPVTKRLIGQSIWNVAAWLEAYSHEAPYEIFSDTDGYGYRITVERIDQAEGGPPRSLSIPYTKIVDVRTQP
jgi:hypothetical protein